MKYVVIGAGVGGLTAASRLAQAGRDVTVLEAHVYAGGCAGTFYHQGYRFDAGATLPAGFYRDGPMDRVGRSVGIERWPVRPADPAMIVHLPDGARVARWAGERRWEERRQAFGPAGESFWCWQESTADALWNLALRMPPWPPQTPLDAAGLAADGLSWLGGDPCNRLKVSLALDAVRPVAAHLRGAPKRLRLFVDAQLLIAAQTTSPHAVALYGASALDLPRRGVVHAEGGMGAIAATLVEAVRRHGGQVLFRHQVTRLVRTRRDTGPRMIAETKRGAFFPADVVLVNLPPWNLLSLLGDAVPRRLRTLPSLPKNLWGAFMLYLGLDGSVVPSSRGIENGFALHHQIVRGEPLGNGHSVFLSLSPAWDRSRAPEGMRAATLSTHTELAPWWDLFEADLAAYEARKAEYTDRLLDAAEVVLPGVREAARLVLPGTPVTFQRFTRRVGGWVGGFPQASLLRAWGPRLAPDLWLVGDSIFPGQSVPAVALGGMRVAESLLVDSRHSRLSGGLEL